MEQKILVYIDDLEDSYGESISVSSGIIFDHKKVLRTIDFYTSSQFESGKFDGLGREKPFYNICNYRVTVAKIATDLDVKDIKFEPDNLNKKTVVGAMLYNKELFKYLKEINFSRTLNEMGLTRPKYGGLLVKRYDDGEGQEIEVVDWQNVCVDPVSILDNPIIEKHYMNPSELAKRDGVWENIDKVLEAHSKANKNKPARIEIKEITGEFPSTFDPKIEDTEANKKKFKTMCFYVACVNKKKFLLYKEDIKNLKDKYRYLEWERIPGRGLGRGIVEDGFEAQVWVNDSIIAWKNAMELSGKVLLSTTSKKVSGNAITGVQSGHIFELEDNKTITSLNLSPSAMPQFMESINAWNMQYDKISSTYDANTGEAPTAGTPYSQTALLNQVANSPFEYQREVWGIFLNEILNDWVKPELKKRIKKPHYLVSEFDDEELKMIDGALHSREKKKIAIEQLGKGIAVTSEDEASIGGAISKELSGFGNKREVEIKEGDLNIDGNLTSNITGELKNKQAILQSLDSVFKTVVSTFNPNTGTYGALEDPTLFKIFANIIEMSGIPLSSAQLKSGKPAQPVMSPVQQQDLSAVNPATPVA